jgi:4'-phosphopantetheinyl transferase
MSDTGLPEWTLRDDEIAVWTIATERWSEPECAESLSADEHARAELIRLPARRAEFIAAHAALRTILGGYQDAPPESLLFTTTCAWCGDPKHGKPRLQEAGGLAFNLTRAGRVALVAVARDVEVGVDAEPLDRVVDWRTIARRALSTAEQSIVESQQPAGRDALAARLWCRKEAVAKATGLGLALELKGWTAEQSSDAPWFAAALTELPEPVLVCDLDLDLDDVDGARAAVAVAGASKPPAVTVREARPD